MIEVLFAILIFSGVILSMAQFGQQFVRADGQARWFVVASELASSRIEMLRGVTDYDSLLTIAGATETAATSSALPSMAHAPGFTRVTTIARDSSSARDHARLTVTVSAPQLATPVAKTLVIARP